jgi:tyrosine-protein kinase Etk/Wzc
VKSGTIGNVRIIDRAAIPNTPVRPVIPLVLVISLALGLVTGIAVAFTRKSLYAGLDDPETVERITGMTVYATVPRSAKLAALSRGLDRRRSHPLLGAIDPGDPAVEAMRSLRTGLQFALLEAKNNVICITGPTAGVGKSFVTINLAHVLANAGRSVLVVDGDLRRGCLHKFFGGSRAPGLSEVLSGTALLTDALQKSGMEGLHWLPTGLIPPNPAELVGSDRFERLLKEVSVRYELVLIDTPPVMPVTDAALIGRYAATTLLVLRAGAHPVREVLSSVKRLAQNGVRVQGAVFNDVSGAGARYSKYSYQYRYESHLS